MKKMQIYMHHKAIYELFLIAFVTYASASITKPSICVPMPNNGTVTDCKLDEMFVCITKFNVPFKLLGYCRSNESSHSGWDCCSDPKDTYSTNQIEEITSTHHVEVNPMDHVVEELKLNSLVHHQTKKKPNVIFILTDDQDAELGSLQAMPRTREILGIGGTKLHNFFVTTPICCPSRVSILSGRYPHNSGAVGRSKAGWCGIGKYYNGTGQKVSLPTYIQAAGYATGIFGKELNCNDDSYISPGWDRFFVLGGNDEGHFYHNWFNDQGKRRQLKVDEYMTNIISAEAEKWIQEVHAQNRSFFAYISPHAPHERATPAPGTMKQFLNVKIPRTPAYNVSCSDKHWMVRTQPALEKRTARSMEEHYRNRLRSLVGVDQLIDSLVTLLKNLGSFENTFIIFTSDHGWHMGQFRLPGFKAQPYDTDLRVPFMVCGPGIPTNRTIDEIGLTIDIAPTIADMIGTTPPEEAKIDGRSLLPLLIAEDNQKELANGWRQDFLFEFDVWPDAVVAYDILGHHIMATGNNTYEGVRHANGHKYVEFHDNENFREFYDIKNDPYELKNIIHTADPTLINQFKQRLEKLRNCTGTSCW